MTESNHTPSLSGGLSRRPEAEPSKMRRGVAVYATNPFIFEVPQRIQRIANKRGDMALVNRNSGEVVAECAGFWQSKTVDTQAFIKLYINGVKALAELTKAGTKVFECLYSEIQENPGKDSICLVFQRIDQKKCSLSRATFSRGLAELLDRGFLAAQPAQGWYWLNPDFIFNGDRIVFAVEYRKRGKETDVPGQQSFLSDQTNGAPGLPLAPSPSGGLAG